MKDSPELRAEMLERAARMRYEEYRRDANRLRDSTKEFYMLMGEVALMKTQLAAMQQRMAIFWETTLKGYNNNDESEDDS